MDTVIPAQAGIQADDKWIPACAGMTAGGFSVLLQNSGSHSDLSIVDQGVALVQLLAQLPSTPYRDKLLAAFPAERITAAALNPPPSSSLANQNLIEPLSERELEVLRLVVTGASNQVIADRLVITVGTVKNHITSILGKLGVRNRWAAIRKTEELRLLL